MRDLPRVVAESPVGKAVDVVIVRKGDEQTVKVTLGRLEDGEKARRGRRRRRHAGATGGRGRDRLGARHDGRRTERRDAQEVRHRRGCVGRRHHRGRRRIRPPPSAASQAGEVITEIAQETGVDAEGRAGPDRRAEGAGPQERAADAGLEDRRAALRHDPDGLTAVRASRCDDSQSRDLSISGRKARLDEPHLLPLHASPRATADRGHAASGAGWLSGTAGGRNRRPGHGACRDAPSRPSSGHCSQTAKETISVAAERLEAEGEARRRAPR